MGSGHILVYMFDILMQIYENAGYNPRDAAGLILKNNLYGLDIDDRAYQLSYFAVMMKARRHNRSIFKENITPHLYAIQESNGINEALLANSKHWEAVSSQTSGAKQGELALKSDLSYLLDLFENAKEYGSILKVENRNYTTLLAALDAFEKEYPADLFSEKDIPRIRQFIEIASILSDSYHTVVTNPPYMGNMPLKMTEYVIKKYNDSRYDMYSVFMEQCTRLTKNDGFVAMITQHTWMFISSFARLRAKLLHYHWVNFVHLGTRAFEAIGGDVVQTVSFVFKNSVAKNYKSNAVRLVEYDNAETKEQVFINGKDIFIFEADNFEILPGKPYVYWLSDKFYNPFNVTKTIEWYVEKKAGVVTGNDPYFVRLWFEPSFTDVSLVGCKGYAKYHIMQKGGGFRRYYGNNEYLIKLTDLYVPAKTNVSVRRGDTDYYFKKAIGWSQVGNSQKSFRLVSDSVCGTATPTIYLKNERYFEYILAFLNSKIAFEYLTAYNPTINLLTTDICNIPLLINEEMIEKIKMLVVENLTCTRADWDSFETSWDFKRHPLV
jgi:hypothetical protein